LNRLAALALATCACGCGDNIHPPPIDAIEIPDLAVVPAQMTGTETIQVANFDETSCEVVEGCVDAVGERRLLAFSAVTANLGTGSLDLGPVPPDGVSSGIFVWSPCHMHHHVIGFASFELLDQTGSLVINGRKQAFCLEDDEQLTPGHPREFDCLVQGISVGWADVYAADIPCEWIDVTGVPSGTYTVRVAIDPDAQFPDSDRSNNVWVDTVEL
jgi:Lysyl oxidase